LAGSIADELGPASVPESTNAVADLDGYTPEPYRPAPQPEPVVPQPELQHADHSEPVATHAPAQEESAQEAEKAARRRSTVREKVSFLSEAQAPVAPAPVPQPSAEPAPQPAPQGAAEDQPRRAGWWSRAFGNGNN
jgi:ribonuclease E